MIGRKVLFCGSREWPVGAIKELRQIMQNELDELGPDDTIMHGGARGSDEMIDELFAGIRPVEVIEPNYRLYPGRIAPLERDKFMVDHSDFVIAFWNGASRGTLYTCNYAILQVKPVKMWELAYGKFVLHDPWIGAVL